MADASTLAGLDVVAFVCFMLPGRFTGGRLHNTF